MDAICIQVKHWLFLNSTSFIQMNDGPWYSALCGNINIHQRPAPLTKSANHQHLLFKWQTAAAGVEHGERTQKKRWTNQFRFQSSKDTRPRAISLMKKGSSTGPNTHNVPPPIGWTPHLTSILLLYTESSKCNTDTKSDFPLLLIQKKIVEFFFCNYKNKRTKSNKFEHLLNDTFSSSFQKCKLCI